MKRYGFSITLLLFLAQSVLAEGSCSTSNFQSCKTCAQLEAAVDLKQPTLEDYYRGAEWNGLFSAYFLNCPIIALKLIKAGASHSSGGSSGSMILTVASKWPHDDKKINDTWAALLLAAGANMDVPLKWHEGRSIREIMVEESWYKPGYFDIYILFDQ